MKRIRFLKGIDVWSFRLILFYSLLLLLILPLQVVCAHPHTFIDMQVDVIFDDIGLAGIKVRWEFDEMFSSMVAEDHDKNRNGKLEEKEISAVKENYFANLSKHNYFCFVKINGKPFNVKIVNDFHALLKKRKLVYEFLVPCQATAGSNFLKIAFASYDPTYYSAVFFDRGKPVSFVSANAYEIRHVIREDTETKIYFDMVNPETLFLEFRNKK